MKLAAANIRDNTGEVVSDEQVNLTVQKALDEVFEIHSTQHYVQGMTWFLILRFIVFFRFQAKVLFRTDNKPINDKVDINANFKYCLLTKIDIHVAPSCIN